MRHAKALWIPVSCLALWAACSAGNGQETDPTSSSTGASPGTGGTDNTGGGFSFGCGDFGGGNTTQLGCTADLRYVVDENGNVVEDCWPNSGCADGMCVAPCTAAAASQGTVGCDFTVATPHFYVGIAPPCFAVFVANNWPTDAPLTVTRDGVNYDATQFGRIAEGNANAASWAPVPSTGVPPGEVAVLFLSQDPSSVNGTPLTCPVTPAINQSQGSAVSGSNVGKAWTITAGVPVSAYDILPYGGASSYLPSAELLLPTSAWGDNYIAV
ncbi:MAG: hypothetical protein KC731_01870, partial [Myxococcales bacterium]|nr:hypothetical protein [Myxococcales bacterium]